MKAIRLHAFGDANQLQYEDVATPEPKAGEVLIKVAAAALNPADWKVRSGAMKEVMPIQLPWIPGFDVAGVVEKTGPGVTNPQLGQTVMGYVPGAYAEYVPAAARDLTVVPDGLGLMQAAALPVVATTGAQFIQRLGLKSGSTVLITGAVGPVGRSAVYMAKHLGLHVIAAVRKTQLETAKAIGADEVVALDDRSAMEALSDLDGVADFVGGPAPELLAPKLKASGVYLSAVGQLPKGHAFRREVYSAVPDASLLRQMADAVRDGRLEIPLGPQFKLSEAAKAQQQGESGRANGKILLLPD